MNKRRARAGLALALAGCLPAAAGAFGSYALHVPESSLEKPENVGLSAHTNHAVSIRPEAAPGGAPSGETPASLACVYKTAPGSGSSCSKKAVVNPTGGFGTIALIDAYDYPTAEADLGVFSAKFGLPACTTANGCFSKVYAAKTKPALNCGWAQETALDIEWSHAMAPNAKIVLVEAKSDSYADLMTAVDVANELVTADGGTGEVSMSWGGSEFSGEKTYDSHFKTTGVVYFASSGDVGGQRIYPGVSPEVVSAGGTSLMRDNSGNFVSESGWSGSGGGPSRYEGRPAYQDVLSKTVGMQRGVPDFSFDADPNTGVSVYDATACEGMSGWMVFGGTSVASPSLAAIVNLANGRRASTAAELAAIYGNLTPSPNYASDFRDIKTGSAGAYRAGTGWDFVTGVGSNLGLNGK